ncbi:hypothetical protein QJU83_02295 [Pasteurella skyensis]|uniref:hypothetical protein n=1 Tax=Phocoenobacter skyensis TaxID=97481 RepID=UPI002763FD3C|nr:hypothetical protein [Pasteurella skyensis]MDP8176373.1 hypothetical protein [Pasteurella skyensis]MDP8199114.1 hypothetical protein [Pasteurella skyensis]
MGFFSNLFGNREKELEEKIERLIKENNKLKSKEKIIESLNKDISNKVAKIRELSDELFELKNDPLRNREIEHKYFEREKLLKENHKKVRDDYEKQIKELNIRIEYLTNIKFEKEHIEKKYHKLLAGTENQEIKQEVKPSPKKISLSPEQEAKKELFLQDELNKDKENLIQFDYTNSKGEFTQRTVRVISFNNEDLRTFDFDRSELRTFKIYRMEDEIIDLNTGVILPKKEWFQQNSWLGNINTPDNPLKDKSIFFIGRPKGCKLSDLKNMAKQQLGVRLARDINSNTDFVCIAGETSSNSVENAEELDLRILTIDDFRKLATPYIEQDILETLY